MADISHDLDTAPGVTHRTRRELEHESPPAPAGHDEAADQAYILERVLLVMPLALGVLAAVAVAVMSSM